MRKSFLLFLILMLVIGIAGCDNGLDDTYTLTIEKEGEGTVVPEVGTHEYDEGTLADLEATPEEGWEFSHWEGDVAEPEEAETSIVMDKDKTIKAIFTEINSNLQIGTAKIVDHPALNAAQQGFIDALDAHGYQEDKDVIYDHQNAQGDMDNANEIAQKFDSQNLDLILSIATPTSQAIANTVKDTPILITAVTDPGAVGVESLEKPGINVTGTTDQTPVKKQLELLKEINPDSTQIGVIYNADEANSQIQLDLTKEACENLGLTLHEATVDSSLNVEQAARSLIDKVDAFYVFHDNTVLSAIDAVIQVAEENKLPLIVGEENSVESGGLATVGINYFELGYQTGKMAVDILEGADPAEMAIQSAEGVEIILNLNAAEAMGVVFPEDLLEKADKIIK